MIYLKTDEEVELMRQSNILLSKLYGELAKHIAPGITTAELDRIAEEYIRDNGGIPACKGYEDFPCALCTSVNEQIVHGIPSKDVVLKDGDIITIDSSIKLNGFHSDSAYTFPVGEISDDVKRLLKTTKQALYIGIEQAVTGRRLGDIGLLSRTTARKPATALSASSSDTASVATCTKIPRSATTVVVVMASSSSPA